MQHAPRSSSRVENLNSPLRNYFTLRRHLGNQYVDLLRYFLNHRRFVRSRWAKREGKGPRADDGRGSPELERPFSQAVETGWGQPTQSTPFGGRTVRTVHYTAFGPG
jgi:hypothetical protein